MSDVIAVFARAPVPGQVKSRLAKDIGDEAAAEVYAAMLKDTLALARRAARARGDCEVCLAYTPDDAFAEGPYSLSAYWHGPRLAQSRGDLGERIYDCIARLQAQGAERIVLIGSDTPDLRPSSIRATFGLLKSEESDLGPRNLLLSRTKDGGFSKIGVSCPVPVELFTGVEWSTDKTLAQVEANATRLQLRWSTSYEGSDDVDTLKDLRALVRRLQRGHSKAPETSRVLRSQNFLE